LHVYAITMDATEARDVVSEAACKAFFQFETLKDVEAFDVWLFQIARREAFRVLRRQKIFDRLTKAHEDIADESLFNREAILDIELLNASIGALPKRYRETLFLHEIGQFSAEEISKIQGGTISGATTRLSRAKKKLEAMILDRQRVHKPKGMVVQKQITAER
jgi:RNA polymerase sigma-70 factor, ECF subfamily